MKKLSAYPKTVIFLLLFPLIFCSCSKPLPPDYRLNGFEAELLWQEGALSLCAVLIASQPSENSGAARPFTLTFRSPDSLAGVTLERQNETVTVRYDGCSADGTAFTSWLTVAELLLSEGVFHPVHTAEQNSEQLLYVTVPSVNSGTYRALLLDPATGFPRKVESENRSVEIRSFTPLS